MTFGRRRVDSGRGKDTRSESLPRHKEDKGRGQWGAEDKGHRRGRPPIPVPSSFSHCEKTESVRDGKTTRDEDRDVDREPKKPLWGVWWRTLQGTVPPRVRTGGSVEGKSHVGPPRGERWDE